MQYINTMVAAILGFALMVQAAPAIGTINNNSVVGTNATYNIIDLEWFVTISPGNGTSPYNISATGTAQDALTAMAAVDPSGAAAINGTINAAINSTASYQSYLAPPRAAYVATDRFCNKIGGGNKAAYSRVQQGISYLGAIPGTPTNGPGPGSCGKVSCSYNAAIYWCNDNLEDKVLDSYLAIADGAQLLVDYCSDQAHHGVNGQQFYQDGWNVIVAGDGNC